MFHFVTGQIMRRSRSQFRQASRERSKAAKIRELKPN